MKPKNKQSFVIIDGVTYTQLNHAEKKARWEKAVVTSINTLAAAIRTKQMTFDDIKSLIDTRNISKTNS
jgi:hypothetical protein